MCFADVEALNFLQGVLHDDLADKLKEVMTGKGKLTANDFEDILPQLTAKLGKLQCSAVLMYVGWIDLVKNLVILVP